MSQLITKNIVLLKNFPLFMYTNTVYHSMNTIYNVTIANTLSPHSTYSCPIKNSAQK